MKKLLHTILLIVCATTLSAQSFTEGRYRITFKDKNKSPYSVENPQAFLSEKAIERRAKFNIAITEQDIPVNPQYISSVTELGAVFCNSSKWFNSAVFYITSEQNFEIIKKLHFIKAIEYIAPKPVFKPSKQRLKPQDSLDFGNDFHAYLTDNYLANYGFSIKQISQLNVAQSHVQNHCGQGMTIAIIDAGFLHVDSAAVFQKIRDDGRLLFARDVTGTAACLDTTLDIFSKGSHGMQVLSLIGGVYPKKLVGTAPLANFILLRSEEEDTEYTVEEDNWVAAAEIADSAGADIISTSLGYSDFDDKKQSYTYRQMDGKTARISIGSNIAASKGMLLVNSAGNSGDDPWKYITAPADADSIITVGACKYNGKKVNFSSFGPTSDGRIKPDVMALGLYPMIATAYGDVLAISGGTSFSCPLVAGCCATLWEEFPDSSAQAIKRGILHCADNSKKPDNKYGNGIPNINNTRIYFYAKQLHSILSEKYIMPDFEKFYQTLAKNKAAITLDFTIDIEENGQKHTLLVKNHTYNAKEFPAIAKSGKLVIRTKGMIESKFKIKAR